VERYGWSSVRLARSCPPLGVSILLGMPTFQLLTATCCNRFRAVQCPSLKFDFMWPWHVQGQPRVAIAVCFPNPPL
jgi:hypothetical protein